VPKKNVSLSLSSDACLLSFCFDSESCEVSISLVLLSSLDLGGFSSKELNGTGVRYLLTGKKTNSSIQLDFSSVNEKKYYLYAELPLFCTMPKFNFFFMSL
jgi:hypothetical protein